MRMSFFFVEPSPRTLDRPSSSRRLSVQLPFNERETCSSRKGTLYQIDWEAVGKREEEFLVRPRILNREENLSRQGLKTKRLI